MNRERNIPLGLYYGLFIAFCFSVIALVFFVLEDSDVPLSDLGFVLSVYWIGGSIGGVIVGLLFPLTVSRWGAVVVGIITGVPMGVGIGLFDPMYGGGMDGIVGGAIAGFLVGGISAYSLWTPTADLPHQKDC